MMKDLNDFYLQKENIKSELKLLEKEENEGMEKLEKNYLLEKKRIRDQFDQKKEKLWKEEDEIEKKNTLFNRIYFPGERSKTTGKSF